MSQFSMDICILRVLKSGARAQMLGRIYNDFRHVYYFENGQ